MFKHKTKILKLFFIQNYFHIRIYFRPLTALGCVLYTPVLDYILEFEKIKIWDSVLS